MDTLAFAHVEEAIRCWSEGETAKQRASPSVPDGVTVRPSGTMACLRSENSEVRWTNTTSFS